MTSLSWCFFWVVHTLILKHDSTWLHLIRIIDVHPSCPSVDIGVLAMHKTHHTGLKVTTAAKETCLNNEVLTSANFLHTNSSIGHHPSIYHDISKPWCWAWISTNTHVLCIPFLSITGIVQSKAVQNQIYNFTASYKPKTKKFSFKTVHHQHHKIHPLIRIMLDVAKPSVSSVCQPFERRVAIS